MQSAFQSLLNRFWNITNAGQNGELDMEKLKEDLWEYGGVKLVESEGEAT